MSVADKQCYVVCQTKQGGAGGKHQTDSTMLGDKTDIFDFGVILLEVVSGKPITSIYEVEIMKELVCMII